MSVKSTERFSNRVEDYVKYRPHYPTEIIDFLENEYHLSSDNKPIIADIGAGTGISSELFLSKGYTVVGIEPNKEMRQKATSLLENYKNCTLQNGTAENTGLGNKSIDIIVAGQAFHWFDRKSAKLEFQRILKTEGLVILIWNERLILSNLEREYESLIVRHGNNYTKVDHRNIGLEQIKQFFEPGSVILKSFENFQKFNFDGLKGRLLSSSYMPSLADKGYTAMVEELKGLFDKYQENGSVQINYDTKVYIGQF